jgi:hypothetical protein
LRQATAANRLNGPPMHPHPRPTPVGTRVERVFATWIAGVDDTGIDPRVNSLHYLTTQLLCVVNTGANIALQPQSIYTMYMYHYTETHHGTRPARCRHRATITMYITQSREHGSGRARMTLLERPIGVRQALPMRCQRSNMHAEPPVSDSNMIKHVETCGRDSESEQRRLTP